VILITKNGNLPDFLIVKKHNNVPEKQYALKKRLLADEKLITWGLGVYI